MNEFDVIDTYFNRHRKYEGVDIGIGDDCAVLNPPSGQNLVVSVDTQVAGQHFPKSASADLIAARSLHCAISDLAAMGAEPLWFTLALSLPESDAAWLQLFSDGLFSAADDYGIALVGGDTTQGPLTISIQVHGAVPPKNLLRRSGARPSDQIFVTGTLGDGAAGLAVVTQELECDPLIKAYFTDRYFAPRARIRAGLLLRYMASSAIDISDGLLADLGHICKASKVGAALDTAKIPLSQELLASVPTGKALEWALTGGDDYQLCFTVSEKDADNLKEKSHNRLIDVTWIGQIVSGDGVVDAHTRKAYNFNRPGFSHF